MMKKIQEAKCFYVIELAHIEYETDAIAVL